MSSLAARQVKNSVVYPTIRVASHPGRLLMGVYDEAGAYVDDTVLDRRSGEVGAPVPPGLFPDVADADVPEAIYAGPLYFHFGHFLVESLARAWYARQRPDLPLVWAGAHTWQGKVLKPWQQEILDVLGLTNQPRILADATRFELLHVPDIGYRYDDRFHPDHAAFLASYTGPAQTPGERLWLSRSGLGSDVRDLNAAPTERRLAASGWTVVHPETLSVREQLDHLSRASVIAGEEGSAFHTLILLADVSGKRFEILRRHGTEHPNMTTIGRARSVDQRFHSLRTEHVLRAEGRSVAKVSPRSSEILDILDVPVPPARSSGLAPAEEPLDRALRALAPTRFLDVDSTSPALALGSDARIRTVVSTRLVDDPRAHAETGVTFYELDLATYEEHFHRGGRFDVIRLGGDDFARTVAAFRASKRLGHERTTWLLGTGELAARVALAIDAGQPGYTAKRMLVHRTLVHVVQRVSDKPRNRGDIARLSAEEVAKRARWLPVTRPRPVVRPSSSGDRS